MTSDKGTILVVDDNPVNLRLLSSILEKYGYETQSANSGPMALDASRISTPELILMDIRMEEMDGYEVCRRLKADEQTRDIPVIFISSLDETEDKVRGFALGGVDFITKPFQKEEVIARIKTHLALRRTQKALQKRNMQLEQEIVERKRAEKALRESEERYRSLFENNPIETITVDKEASVTGYNRAKKISSGKVPNLGDIMYKDYAPSHEIDMHQELLECIQSGIMKTFPEQKYKDKYLYISISPFPGGAIITSIDMTARKLVEKALQESDIKYQDLYENSPDMLVTVDINTTKILECNKTLADTLGYTKDEIIGRSIFDLYDTDSAEHVKAKVFPLFRETGMIKGEELRIQRKDGDTIDVSLHMSAIRDENGIIHQGRSSWRDISDKKRLEAQLQQAQKMEAIGTLAGGIAHDFNNILGIVVGNAELAMDDIPEWNPALHNLKEVRKACLRARDIVKQILAFSRRSKQEMKPVKIIPIILESLQFLRSSIPTTIEIRHNILCRNDVANADPIQINQVLINLCTNASHAMREKGGIIEVTLKNVQLDEDAIVRYPGLEPGRYIRLIVSDTGHGIRPEIQERIFDPYFTTKEVGEGSGMGLAVVLGIIKNHNGAISVDSVPGKGTTFHVLLPSIIMEVSEEIEDIEVLPRGNERILFVDDEKAIVDPAKSILERLGYQVEAKTNSIETLKAFRANQDAFDLIITDTTMPNMTGVDLAKEILQIRSDMPIIICTGFSEKINIDIANQLGVSFFMKPIIIHELAVMIRDLLDKNTDV